MSGFYLTQDGDCHWYIVPVAKRAEWDAWRDIPEDDERSWDVPDFAVRFQGGAEAVSFPSYDIDPKLVMK